ncbi:hypothetical protein QOZ80_7BG0587330 [Eleusine coracana subsp. coracana]|nr:hypothetical protein QOZ80_7BG0587330 [Eleusine coracana subsp. coracana]
MDFASLFIVAMVAVASAAAVPAPASAVEETFKASAYPVKWTEHDSAQTPGGPEGEAAYPVKWTKDASAQAPGGPEGAAQAAYPVKWTKDASGKTTGGPEAQQAAGPAHGGGLHVKRGMLFLRKSLFPGAVLPQGTRLAGKSMMRMRDAEPFNFSLKVRELEQMLKVFRITPGSARAEQVLKTLQTCDCSSSADPHVCATSDQAELQFAAQVLGTSGKRLRRVISSVQAAANKEPDVYAVAANGISRIVGGGAALVACHPMDFPYTVRYCHRPSKVEAFLVKLTGVGGGATAATVCHKDTTTWDSTYFDLLNATRGEEICHFMPHNYVLWVKMDV